MKLKNLVLIAIMTTICAISGCGNDTSKELTETAITEKNIETTTETITDTAMETTTETTANSDNREKSNTSEADKTEEVKKTSEANKDVVFYSDGHAFRNSNLGDTIDEVNDAEPFELHEDKRPMAEKGNLFYVSGKVEIDGKKAIIGYKFQYGKLTSAAISFDMDDGDKMKEELENLKNYLCIEFGEPTDVAVGEVLYDTDVIIWEKNGVKYSIAGRDRHDEALLVFNVDEIK